MGLSPGTRLGPYQIAALIGAGGMGEVYRARDTRLGRDVAIKVISAELSRDPDRINRFEREARAAGALSHPNVCAIYDVGTHEGAPFLVTELLEGETLRERVRGGPLPLRRGLEIARGIADGLVAAHAKGIAHRDLKPENIFITREGHPKILDFGIAKLAHADVGPDGGAAETISGTRSGIIVGTVGYMAPEQVRGEAADQRADLFALGCVLHEMLSGRRAFGGSGTVDTLHAILHADPPPLRDLRPEVEPALSAVVQHCLEKDPALRFQTARDVAFALGSLAGATGAARQGTAGPVAGQRWRRLGWFAVAAVLALAAALAVIALRGRGAPQPSFERLTFRRGSLSSARFSADGATIVYSAAWDGEPTRVYSTRLDSRESSPLPLPDARLLAVSITGDLAIAIGPGSTFIAGSHTTLARVPLAGGAPREIAEEVSEADWSPDGRELALAHYYSSRTALEYPSGRVIWQTTSGVANPRVSPRGDLVAFIELDTRSDYSRGYVSVVDRAGRARRLTRLWENLQGLAWGPGGDEVWFTGAHNAGSAKQLWAVSLRGRERLLLSTPGNITLRDVASDGATLVSQDDLRHSLLAMSPGANRERDLSWQDVTGLADLSPDGRRLIFTEYSEAYGKDGVIGMRATDGSPVVHLGDGYAGGLSPDGKWVVAIMYGARPHLSLLPTGAGQIRNLDPGPVKDFDWSCWAPDGQHVLFGGIESGRGARAYVQDTAGGPPRAITPEGIPGWWRGVTPDGKFLAGARQDSMFLFPLEGGASRYVPTLRPSDGLMSWLPDGKSALLAGRRDVLPVRVERMDLETGERRPVRDLTPQDPAGVSELVQIIFTPDTRAWAYTYRRTLSNLYLVKGLR